MEEAPPSPGQASAPLSPRALRKSSASGGDAHKPSPAGQPSRSSTVGQDVHKSDQPSSVQQGLAAVAALAGPSSRKRRHGGEDGGQSDGREAKRYAPAHCLEAEDFCVTGDGAGLGGEVLRRSRLEALPAEVLARLGGLLNVKDLTAYESASRRLRCVARRHVWPTFRSLKISHLNAQQNDDGSCESEAGCSSAPPVPSTDALKVALSVGGAWTEDVVSLRGVAAVAPLLAGLRVLVFGVQAHIQHKAHYEQIYQDEFARSYREKSERVMRAVAAGLPRQLPVHSLTFGSYFEMSSQTAGLMERLCGTLRSVTMSFRWIHRRAPPTEILQDSLLWTAVWRAIQKCSSVEVLKVYKTSMAELGSGPVLAAVKDKPRLSRLCLVCEGFQGTQMAEIIAALPEGSLRVLFLEPNGGSALEHLRDPAVWATVGKALPRDPGAQLDRLRKFGFSSRDHLSLPSALPLLPNLWEILIVGRNAGPQLLQEVTELTSDYLMAKRHARTVKPICVRIHTEDDRWRERNPAEPEFAEQRARDEAFGRGLMEAVKARTSCHAVNMDQMGKWGFRLGNSSVVVTGEKPCSHGPAHSHAHAHHAHGPVPHHGPHPHPPPPPPHQALAAQDAQAAEAQEAPPGQEAPPAQEEAQAGPSQGGGARVAAAEEPQAQAEQQDREAPLDQGEPTHSPQRSAPPQKTQDPAELQGQDQEELDDPAEPQDPEQLQDTEDQLQSDSESDQGQEPPEKKAREEVDSSTSRAEEDLGESSRKDQ